jgi:hypothetical protein
MTDPASESDQRRVGIGSRRTVATGWQPGSFAAHLLELHHHPPAGDAVGDAEERSGRSMATERSPTAERAERQRMS